MQSNFRLWYRTLSGAHQDIKKRLHFPHLFFSRPSEILNKVLPNKCLIGLVLFIHESIYRRDPTRGAWEKNRVFKVFAYYAIPVTSAHDLASETIQPNSMPFQRNCVKCTISLINFVDPQINSSLFPYN